MRILAPLTITAVALGSGLAAAETDLDALAEKLSNPVAALISVPIQFNYDTGFGAGGEGDKYLINIQPVIPVTLNDEWNLISRTIVPVIHVDDIVPGQSESGLGDILQSAFLSPQKPGPGGLIWGAGPALLLPTATDDLLGGGKWAVGPTAVALVQRNGWTVGGLINHLWSVAGDDDRGDIDATFMQPFLSKAVWRGGSVALNTETTYDWEAEEWTVPVNLSVAQVLPIAGQLTSIALGYRHYVDKPDGGPDWGVRLVVTLLFPR